MSNAAKFIITALLIFGAVMAYKTYQDGGFKDAKGIDVTTEDVEDH